MIPGTVFRIFNLTLMLLAVGILVNIDMTDGCFTQGIIIDALTVDGIMISSQVCGGQSCVSSVCDMFNVKNVTSVRLMMIDPSLNPVVKHATLPAALIVISLTLIILNSVELFRNSKHKGDKKEDY
jgi:hypothetical protein